MSRWPWLPVAETLASKCYDSDLDAGEPRLIRSGDRNDVFQVPLQGAGPTSIVCKVMKEPNACGYTDWASLELLGSLDPERRLAPAFVGGDADASLVVLQDLGPALSLHDRLNGRDLGRCLADLEAMAVTTAHLHRLGAECEEQWQELRQALPLPTSPGRHRESLRWWGEREKVEAWCASLGITLPSGLHESLRDVAAAYAVPGPFLAFTHGDMAPTNNHVGPDGFRLLDFEYGGFRHALYDLTAWYVLCPLPTDVAKAIVSEYRRELGRTWAIIRDDEAFAAAFAQMVAYRALAMLQWIRPAVLAKDAPWVGDWSCRGALLAATSRLVAGTSGIDSLGPLTLLGERLHATLQRRWPEIEDPLPPWAVFQT